MKSITQMRTDLITKAEEDEDFRARLVADPKTTVSDELGIKLPENFHLHVV